MVVNKMGYAFSGMTIRCHNGASWVTGLVYFGKDVKNVLVLRQVVLGIVLSSRQ